MRKLIPILLALLLLGASWQPTGLRVVWSEAESVCLFLAGGGLPTWRYADVPCAATGDVVLARGGDYLLSPTNRDAVEFYAQSDLTRLVSSQEIPGTGFRVRLPIIVGQENAPVTPEPTRTPIPTPTPTPEPRRMILPYIVR